MLVMHKLSGDAFHQLSSPAYYLTLKLHACRECSSIHTLQHLDPALLLLTGRLQRPLGEPSVEKPCL